MRINHGPESRKGRKLVRSLKRSLLPVFDRLEEATQRALDHTWANRPRDLTKDLTDDERAFADAFVRQATDGLVDDLRSEGKIGDHVQEVLQLRLQAAAAAFGVQFDHEMYNELSAEYARIHAYDKGVLVDIEATVKEILGNRIRTALEHGWTHDMVRSDITRLFNGSEAAGGMDVGLKKWEVQRIAKTEINDASRWGNRESVRKIAGELGLTGMRAILIPSISACDYCLSVAADTQARVWTAEDADNEELHPNCECDWAYEFDELEEAA